MANQNIVQTGTYKIFGRNSMFIQWHFVDYRIDANGIMEARTRGNSFAQWQVIKEIPEGAQIISKKIL